MAKGKGVGQGFPAWAERWDKGEGAMGWGGDLGQGGQGQWLWSGGGKGLGQGGDSDITQKYS